MRWGSRVYLATIAGHLMSHLSFLSSVNFSMISPCNLQMKCAFSRFPFFFQFPKETPVSHLGAWFCCHVFPSFSSVSAAFDARIKARSHAEGVNGEEPLSNWMMKCDKTWQACLLGIYGYIIFEQLLLWTCCCHLLSLKFFLGSLSVPVVSSCDVRPVQSWNVLKPRFGVVECRPQRKLDVSRRPTCRCHEPGAPWVSILKWSAMTWMIWEFSHY